MPAPVDHAGKRFGYLTAISRATHVSASGRKVPAWRLRCDCGAEVVAITGNLVRGRHRSCGCKKSELMREATGVRWITKHPAYPLWASLIGRCETSTASNFRFYGGKGVRICDRWRHGEDGKHGAECIHEDMGPRPPGLTLGRIDPYGDYEPGNCRWATWAEQFANRRKDFDKRRLDTTTYRMPQDLSQAPAAAGCRERS